MVKNVLLMLSSDQPPPPTEEIQWHTEQCSSRGFTYLITTRRLTDMTPRESIVSFYGNAELGNRYLGQGIFFDYLKLETPKGQQIFKSSSLYQSRGIPDGAQGFIRLLYVQEAKDHEQLDALNGIIVSSGKSDGLPLILENIPKSAARLQVYYRQARETA